MEKCSAWRRSPSASWRRSSPCPRAGSSRTSAAKRLIFLGCPLRRDEGKCDEGCLANDSGTACSNAVGKLIEYTDEGLFKKKVIYKGTEFTVFTEELREPSPIEMLAIECDDGN